MTTTRRNHKFQSLFQFGLFLGVVFFLNVLANSRFGGRSLYATLDLTEDKKYTLTAGTKRLLRDLDEVVYIKVLFEGQFPAGFKRLRTSIGDVLEDFRAQNPRLEYDFENPLRGSTKESQARLAQLRKDGLAPVNLTLQINGETTQRPVFPYAILNYRGRTLPINLLENEVPGVPDEVVLNNAIGLLEYKLASGIQKLQRAVKPHLFFTSGHGELNPMETADLERTLRRDYLTDRLALDSVVQINPRDAALLIVAKPRLPFSEQDKFKLDQYVMNGGKIIWLIDKVAMDLDSLNGRPEYLPSEYNLDLDDLLFRYGVRLQPNFALDYQCSPIKLVTGRLGNAPQFSPFNYPYHVVAIPRSNHPVVKSLAPVNFLFAGSIDTLRTKTPLRKTVLLTTSERSRQQFLPLRMNFDFLKYELDPTKFRTGIQPLAVLLEGVFSSPFENRITPALEAGLAALKMSYRATSVPTKMVVVADGDVAKNKVYLKKQQIAPLGFNEFAEYRFANKDFLINTIEYLLDDAGVIAARGKDVKLRLLDVAKAKSQKQFWQLLNLGLPLLLLVSGGALYLAWRQRRYSKISPA